MLTIWNTPALIIILIHIIILSSVEGILNLNGSNIYPDNQCSNPNGLRGLCVSLYYCPTLLKLFLNTPNFTDIEGQTFLQNSTCVNGFGPNPFVCCTYEVGFTETSYKAATLLATSDECIGPKTTYYYGTRVADIRDYHWMALLEYKRPSREDLAFLCQGSLISHRYVLTAAHCFQKQLREIARVRLGEYDLDTDIDCDGDTCLGPVIYVDIEKIIRHSQYSEWSKVNDIGLLRLANYVPFDKNISPICLPSTVGFNGSNVGEGLFVAGFVTPDYSQQQPRNFSKKLQVNVPLFDQNQCELLYGEKGLNITKNHLCAGGNLNEDNSSGDGGGALMRRVNKGNWVIEGIVSTGLYPGSNFPSVYTRVSEYENWILENIET